LARLKAIFGKWLGSECGLLDSNPFAKVKPPKCDEPDMRIVLPAVYLEVAALVGWRATEIAGIREDGILADGFVRVLAESEQDPPAQVCLVAE